MKSFLPALAVLAFAGTAGAQTRPPQAPPVRVGVSVGNEWVGVDPQTKTVDVPDGWKVARQRPPLGAPVQAPPVVAAPSLTYAQAYAMAKAGHRLILAVGEAPRSSVEFYGTPVYVVTDAPAGPGHYQMGATGYGVVYWWKPGWEVQQHAPLTAPGVAAPAPFASAPPTRAVTVVTTAQGYYPTASALGPVVVNSSGSRVRVQTGNTTIRAEPAAPAGPIRRLMGAGLFGGCGPGG